MIHVANQVFCDVCKAPAAELWTYEARASLNLPVAPAPAYDFTIHGHHHMLCAGCAQPLIKLLGEMYGGDEPSALLARNGYRLDETHGEWRKD